jgi:hypothetical protein
MISANDCGQAAIGSGIVNPTAAFVRIAAHRRLVIENNVAANCQARDGDRKACRSFHSLHHSVEIVTWDKPIASCVFLTGIVSNSAALTAAPTPPTMNAPVAMLPFERGRFIAPKPTSKGTGETIAIPDLEKESPREETKLATHPIRLGRSPL